MPVGRSTEVDHSFRSSLCKPDSVYNGCLTWFKASSFSVIELCQSHGLVNHCARMNKLKRILSFDFRDSVVLSVRARFTNDVQLATFNEGTKTEILVLFFHTFHHHS